LKDKCGVKSEIYCSTHCSTSWAIYNQAIEQSDKYWEQEMKKKDIEIHDKQACMEMLKWANDKLKQKLSVDNIERVLNILFKESGDKQVKSVEEKGRWACDFETLNSKTIAEAIHKLVGEDNV